MMFNAPYKVFPSSIVHHCQTYKIYHKSLIVLDTVVVVEVACNGRWYKYAANLIAIQT